MEDNEYSIRYFESLHHRGEGHFDEAIAIYNARRESHPSDATNLWNLAVTLSQQGKVAEALETIRQALAINPQSYTFTMSLVQILWKTQGWQEAIEQSRELVKMRPDLSSPYALLGRSLAGSGDMDQAIEAFEKAVTLRAASPDMRNELIELCTRAGRTEEAETWKRQFALEKKPFGNQPKGGSTPPKPV